MTYPLGHPSRAAVRPSPVFLGVLAVAAVSGFVVWGATDVTRGTRFAVFVFVMAAWVVSLCLHEFSHAFSAWRAGDHEVEARGYLTLNPLKYSHPVLSILLPIVFIAIGGIGLPGGAVYLRPHLFRTRFQRAMVSLAGPLVNLGLALAVLVVVKTVGPSDFAVFLNGNVEHSVFWSAVSFLAYLQVMAAVLNLLPIPGLDGYAAIEPYLKPETQRAAEQFKGYGMLAVFVLLQVGAVNSVFFGAIHWIFELSGVPRLASDQGYALVKFWSND
jgi:Zn-dependent protease